MGGDGDDGGMGVMGVMGLWVEMDEGGWGEMQLEMDVDVMKGGHKTCVYVLYVMEALITLT